MSTQSKPSLKRPSIVALALSASLLVTSIAAFVLQQFPVCSGCSVTQGLSAWIAPAGALGYAILTILGWLGAQRVFTIGTGVAAGVHSVLLAAMITRGGICLLCVIAAALAILLFILTLARSNSRVKHVAFAYVPTVLAASGAVIWAAEREQALEREWQVALRIARQDPGDGAGGLTIQVFEQDHCGYCRDFREFYLPQLARDFKDRVLVRFLPATATSWVRRTPTIVVEGGPVYEGLPRDYSELQSAVHQALAARK